MATKTTKKTQPKAPAKTRTKTKAKPDTGTIGYRHLPGKDKRFKRQPRPDNIKKLPSIIDIIKSTSLMLWQNRGLLLGIAIVYGLLNLILVQGLSSSSEITTLKNEIHKGSFGALVSSASIFAMLIGSSGNGSSQTASAYQLPLTIIASLAIIWTLRQIMSGHKVRIRDAYYKGMYPLIPFILVLLVMAVQLLPLVIGAAIYSIIITNNIAIGFVEELISLIIFLVLAFWPIYMLCSSVFALYIVTLPNMTPIKALRSAKQLVKFRRLSIFRKLLALPITLLIIAAAIMLPIILWLTVLSRWVFFILTMLTLLTVHAYIYTVYRDLLDE